MTFYEALKIMVHGGTASRRGTLYKFGRGGIYDVTSGTPVFVRLSPEDIAATDYTSQP
jgi:hypothetical protein